MLEWYGVYGGAIKREENIDALPGLRVCHMTL